MAPTRRAFLLGTAAAAVAAAVADGEAAEASGAGPAAVAHRFAHRRPRAWGEALPGVLTRLPRHDTPVGGQRRPVVCLTFDACGSRTRRHDYDADLIATLRAHQVPATLFLTKVWTDAHPHEAADLARDPLFELANHGATHRPLSVTGRSAYRIRGTRNAAEAVQEVWEQAVALQHLTGHAPRFFRSGTAFYDDVGVAIAHALGHLPVGYTISTDGGAHFPAPKVRDNLLALPPGGISLAHFNHPEKGTAEGLAAALPAMKAKGWVFVKVSDGLRTR